jgi:radical SAM protein with 4Fe4S-binding SPASM domain
VININIYKKQNRVWLSYFINGFIQKYLKQYPLFVTFFVTSKCNAKCKHCFYWKETSEFDKKKELSVKEIEKISKNMHNFPFLLISGGEPFLRKNLADICKIFYDNNKVQNINIPTNGILTKDIITMTQQILKECPNSLITIQLSIDGLFKKHDKIRNVKGAFNNLIRTYNELSLLKKRFKNIEVTFCFTFSYFSKYYVKEVYEFVIKKLNCSRIFTVLIRGNARDKKSKEIDIKKYEEIIPLYNNLLGESKQSKLSYHNTYKTRSNLLYRNVAEIYKKNHQLMPCYAGILNVVISERGVVYPCEILNKELGDLRKNNYDFNRIWKNEKAKNIRRWIQKSKCFCTDETFVANNCRFSLRFYIGLFKEMLKFRFSSKYKILYSSQKTKPEILK